MFVVCVIMCICMIEVESANEGELENVLSIATLNHIANDAIS